MDLVGKGGDVHTVPVVGVRQRGVIPNRLPDAFTADTVPKVIAGTGKRADLPIFDSLVGADTPIVGVGRFEVGVVPSGSRTRRSSWTGDFMY